MTKIIKEIHLDSPSMNIKKIEWEELEGFFNIGIFTAAKIVASKKHKKSLRLRSSQNVC